MSSAFESSTFEAPDLSALIELARNPRVDMKPAVLRVQTDLFLAAPIRDRAVLDAFTALATGLVPTVDLDTACNVAAKLAPCPETPPEVLHCLIARGSSVAEVVLARMPALSPECVRAAQAVGADIDAVLVQRRTAGRSNHGAARRSLAEEIEAARRDHAAACELLLRNDIAPADLAPLWLLAEPSRRAEIRDAIEPLAALRGCPPVPRGLSGQLNAASRVQDVKGVLGILAETLGVPANFLNAAPDPAARFDLLTLALRACDLPEADAIYVFLTLNDTVARSVKRVYELVDLYRTTSRIAARELLGAILDTTLSERGGTGEHRAYHGPEASVRQGQATERNPLRAAPAQRARHSG